MSNPYIRLRSGKKFHILRPTLSEIDIEDIAHALSNICRFTGHTTSHYSVAQHSCLVSDALESKELKFVGLLHDASEAYCNDIASPLKKLLPEYIDTENKIQELIARKYKISYPFPAIVKVIDRVLLATELRDLMGFGDEKNIPLKPLEKKITPWNAKKSRDMFLKKFEMLRK